MKIFSEWAGAFHDAVWVDEMFPPRNPRDHTSRTSIIGSLGAWYHSTWDDRIRSLIDEMAPGVVAWQNADGWFSERITWMQYVFTENIHGIPKPVPALVSSADRFGRASVRLMERQPPHWLPMLAFAYWHEYRRTGDPLCVLRARQGRERRAEFHRL